MLIGMITDQHFGVRNDSAIFMDFYQQFYENSFFPTLKALDIKNLIVLGDTFDRRKFVNFYSLQRAKEIFFEPLKKMDIKVHMLIGNHDTYYRNTNEINSPELLLEDYDFLNIIKHPTEITIDNNLIAMVPWICQENYDQSMEFLENTKAKLCMGHFEIEGFQMYRGAPAEEGLKPAIFKKFDVVFSGHYHHRSSRDNIHYLGNPYELTWQDYNDPRGFHIFNLENYDLNFIKNPYTMFCKITYDDKKDDIKTYLKMDLAPYKNKYVKIVVINKSNPYLFEQFISKLFEMNPADVTVVEDFSEVIEDDEEVVDQAEDTPTILNKYIDSLNTDLSKKKLKSAMREIYMLALNEEK